MRNILWLLAALLAVSAAVTSCGKDNVDGPNSGPTIPPAGTSINAKVDNYLKERYLWSDEYKTLTPDFSLAYNSFLEKTLLKMTTNIYDKKPYVSDDGKSYYQLYSYIERKPLSGKSVQTTRGVNHGVAKESQISFGIASMTVIAFQGSSDYGFLVTSVYPGSAADKAGVKRGFVIQKIDGENIKSTNYETLYYLLLTPGGIKTVALTENAPGLPVKTLTSEELFPNPVLLDKILTVGNHKIGYLAYKQFDAGFDDDLLAAIKRLKDGGVNDLVLDLRLNGGGHVLSSQMLSSCIAGAASGGKVYQYYRYNDARMADPTATARQVGMGYDAAKKKFYENFISDNYYGVDLRNYALGLPRLFVLVSGDTASASEAVINALRGINIPVTLIGQRTNGKNVGMEPVELTDDTYSYELVPITFQGYNAKELSVDHLGLIPEHVLNDWNYQIADFGDAADPLLAKAVELIAGIPAREAVKTRSGSQITPANIRLPKQSGVSGMILLPPTGGPK